MAHWRNIIQVAGVRSLAEARMVAACGATHVGLPLRLPVHKEDVSEEQARDIVHGLAGAAQTVLITYLTGARETIDFCRFLGVEGVQLHGAMPLSELRQLREAAPDLFLIKSLVVGTADEAALLAVARGHAPFVDAFLTDTFDPASGASGATGLVHDWAVSRRLAQALSSDLARPLILAGGLTPGNVAEAIAQVAPAGVDAHTGLEDAEGNKVEGLVRSFVAAARAALGAGSWPGLAKARDKA